jgi:hypothetical protein
MPPKRVPIVSTGKLKAQASSDSDTSATTGAGTREVARSALTVSILSSCLRNCESTAHRRGQMKSPTTQTTPSPSA